MRTQQEIVERIKERKPGDIFGFEWAEYLTRLDYQHATPYLNKDATQEGWEGARESAVPDDILLCIAGYMDFAFGKAVDERGISANRSILHMIAWLWLAGEDELLERVKREYDANYHDYGLPILRMIAEHFALPIPDGATECPTE